MIFMGELLEKHLPVTYLHSLSRACSLWSIFTLTSRGSLWAFWTSKSPNFFDNAPSWLNGAFNDQSSAFVFLHCLQIAMLGVQAAFGSENIAISPFLIFQFAGLTPRFAAKFWGLSVRLLTVLSLSLSLRIPCWTKGGLQPNPLFLTFYAFLNPKFSFPNSRMASPPSVIIPNDVIML